MDGHWLAPAPGTPQSLGRRSAGSQITEGSVEMRALPPPSSCQATAFETIGAARLLDFCAPLAGRGLTRAEPHQGAVACNANPASSEGHYPTRSGSAGTMATGPIIGPVPHCMDSAEAGCLGRCGRRGCDRRRGGWPECIQPGPDGRACLSPVVCASLGCGFASRQRSVRAPR